MGGVDADHLAPLQQMTGHQIPDPRPTVKLFAGRCTALTQGTHGILCFAALAAWQRPDMESGGERQAIRLAT